jgi:dihydrofolate reductase
MRKNKLVVSEFITLDGVIEAPGGEESLGTLAGWSFPFWNEEIAKFKLAEVFATGALLLGRKTYQGFAAAWPGRTDEQGFADRMNSLPKLVASTTLTSLEWNNSRLIKGSIADEVNQLKGQVDQDVLVAGSGELVDALRQQGLVDEYRLLVYPVVLGRGKRLFGEGTNIPLKLVETRAFSTGVVLLRYERAGM